MYTPLCDAAYLLLCISEPSVILRLMKLCDHDSRILVTSGDFYYPRAVRISLIMPSQVRELIVLEAPTLCCCLCPPDPMEG